MDFFSYILAYLQKSNELKALFKEEWGVEMVDWKANNLARKSYWIKEGVIYHYRFHGTGCEFLYQNFQLRVCDIYSDRNETRFCGFDMYVFITSFYGLSITEKDCHAALDDLEIQGLIRKADEVMAKNYPFYGVYVIR